jgi:hypothetical protein
MVMESRPEQARAGQSRSEQTTAYRSKSQHSMKVRVQQA